MNKRQRNKAVSEEMAEWNKKSDAIIDQELANVRFETFRERQYKALKIGETVKGKYLGTDTVLFGRGEPANVLILGVPTLDDVTGEMYDAEIMIANSYKIDSFLKTHKCKPGITVMQITLSGKGQTKSGQALNKYTIRAGNLDNTPLEKIELANPQDVNF